MPGVQVPAAIIDGMLTVPLGNVFTLPPIDNVFAPLLTAVMVFCTAEGSVCVGAGTELPLYANTEVALAVIDPSTFALEENGISLMLKLFRYVAVVGTNAEPFPRKIVPVVAVLFAPVPPFDIPTCPVIPIVVLPPNE